MTQPDAICVRFAPSPTGYLHIGGARTALFNYLFARHMGGKYLLRIEDTDKARSTQPAIAAIIEGLDWLGLSGDAPYILQSANLKRHQEVALKLLEEGKAYRCYATPDELEAMREKAKEEGRQRFYDGCWRDKEEKDYIPNQPYSVRIKMPQDAEKTTIHDWVQGEVSVAHQQLDDFILLRSDGSPTYMLSVVVDDHDMGITHIIRGDDHLNNAFRQYHLFKAAGWQIPEFAHIPLIHNPEGSKLSKRDGALGAHEYREMGYLPQGVMNYLLRLGWSHGDDEFISLEQAIEWFDLHHVGKSPSRMDFTKLRNMNAHYMRQMEDVDLFTLLKEDFKVGQNGKQNQALLIKGIKGLKIRSSTLAELAEGLKLYQEMPSYEGLNEKNQTLFTAGKATLKLVLDKIESFNRWESHDAINEFMRNLAQDEAMGFGKLAQPIRIALSGLDQSPGLLEMMEVLGKTETKTRLNHALAWLEKGAI